METQITKLKKQLFKLNKEYHVSIYKILNKIYTLRLKDNKKYTIKDLSHESVIKGLYTYHYVCAIMQIRFITPEVHKLIKENSFSLFEVANALRKSKALHDKDKQIEFFTDMANSIDRGLTKKEFREKVTLYNMGLKKNMSEEDIWVLQTVYSIRTYARKIMERYNKLSDVNKTRVTCTIKELYDFVKDGKSKYKLVAIHKDKIKMLRECKSKGIYPQETRLMVETAIDKVCGLDNAFCKGCGIEFKKNRKDQVFHDEQCRHNYNNKKSNMDKLLKTYNKVVKK